ncbi:MAG: formylglycine-generating enzyme family protein [Candidatus Poribacteria bacterium]|nr:formylglycine-generating enzyme family protein [Candidatus Poribacteria bacterium]MDE0503442.1 formylglycine-generating enzyme family protein [Candidatus Poribacteria bacterium]
MTNQNPQLKTVGLDGGIMALIPAGEFLMGAVDDDDMGYAQSLREENPQHAVYLDAYHIDVYQVTNAKYKRFVDATAHPSPNVWTEANFNMPNQPVVGVSWFDAVAYANWAGKRLPTEAEWEKAARGRLVNKRYPWGDDPPDGTQCNFKDRDVDTDILYDETVSDGYRYTAPVGSYPPNGYGLYDMAGNVFEWCADDRIPYSESPKHNPIGPTDGSARAVRGGGYLGPMFHVRCSRRGGSPAHIAASNTGFRCAAATEG